MVCLSLAEVDSLMRRLFSKKKEFIKFMGLFVKNKSIKREQTASIMKGDFDDVEVGFVNGLVELYNLRDRISKYKAEIISM